MEIINATEAPSWNAQIFDGLKRFVPAEGENSGYGAALYVSAKSMTCRLYDLSNGKLLAHTSASGDYDSFSGDELKGLMTDIFETLATSAKITLAKIKFAAVGASTAMESTASGRVLEELVYDERGGCDDFGCDVEYILPGSASIAVGQAYFMPCLGSELGGDFLGCLLALDVLSTENPMLVVYSDPDALGNDMSIALALGSNGELSVCAVPAGTSINQAIMCFIEACGVEGNAIEHVAMACDSAIELSEALRGSETAAHGAPIEGVSAILMSEDAEDELCRIVSSCKVVSL